jgi:alpha-galactosidase
MQTALNNCGRDIIYSLCQYGMGNVWEWGASVDGNCWRTTGDITDNWNCMSLIGFNQDGHEKYAGPGHWNDPDMLIVGMVGWGNPHPTELTKHEQVTHMTLWSLLASPLLIGCDMTKLDAFTRDLLCNDEVLDVDQDPLGKPAGRIQKNGTAEVWARPLCDGTKAVGLFNRGEEPTTITVNFAKDLGITAKRVPVRDLWQRKQLKTRSGSFEAVIYPHCAMLIKVGTPQPIDAYIPAE